MWRFLLRLFDAYQQIAVESTSWLWEQLRDIFRVRVAEHFSGVEALPEALDSGQTVEDLVEYECEQYFQSFKSLVESLLWLRES